MPLNEDNFDQYLADIMSAVYGEEVRGSIRSALEILHGLLIDAEDSITVKRDEAAESATNAATYAAQAMATTPEGYDQFAVAIADVISDVYISEFEIEQIFTPPITDTTDYGQASEDPTYTGTEEP